ncbi:MAG: di-heme oxidoredictase family protein [Ferruginibacter sp.]
MRKTRLIILTAVVFVAGFSQLASCSKTKQDVLAAETNEEYSGGLKGSTFDFSENAFGKEFANLDSKHLQDFVVGNSFFRNNWVTAPASTTARDGLGVLFNSMSCGGCHHKDGRAAPPESETAPLNGLLFRISIPGSSDKGGPLAEPNYGLQLNNRAILGVTVEGNVSVTYTEIAGRYPDGTGYYLRKPTYTFKDLGYGAMQAGTMYSPRIANQVMGLGLLEAVPEATILGFADENDANKDGISGRPNYVWNFKTNKTELGRFGWKANQPTILQQTASALSGDIGITTTLFPNENLSPVQHTMYGSLPNGGSPEIDDEGLGTIISYMQTLAVPGRRNVSDATVLKGKQLFVQASCANCHKPVMQTGSNSLPQLDKQTIRPYTDLLLHDMGDELSDGRPDYLATGNEWRTPPLWGIGLIPTVNDHTFLLHDGRARNIEEAILWHGGEAAAAKEAFKKLKADERAAVIKFLESL